MSDLGNSFGVRHHKLLLGNDISAFKWYNGETSSASSQVREYFGTLHLQTCNTGCFSTCVVHGSWATASAKSRFGHLAIKLAKMS